jgi:hypothetical protein
VLPLTVLSVGLAFVGIGVAVSGVLSTIFIAAGIAVAVGSLFLHLLRSPSTSSAEVALATTETASAGDVGPGAVAGNIIKDSTVTVTDKGGEPQKTRRQIVEVEPEYLTGFYREHLAIQADSLMEPFVGKSMRVSGRVEDVARRETFASLHLDRDSPAEEPAGVHLYFYDDKYIDERVRTLTKGQQVTVVGKIEKANSWGVDLGHCEFEAAGG